jgi:hypothetical protein
MTMAMYRLGLTMHGRTTLVLKGSYARASVDERIMVHLGAQEKRKHGLKAPRLWQELLRIPGNKNEH